MRAGEIVGVCGVAGNGQRELAEAIAGMRRAGRAAPSTIAGTALDDGRPAQADRAAGVAHVPEDRLHTGLAPSLPIEDNLVLKSYRRPPMASGPFLRRGAHPRATRSTLIERFDVRAPGPTTPTRVLSGGNVQKVLLAREFSCRPDGARRRVADPRPRRRRDRDRARAARRAAADRGVGVLLISEDLDEVLALADRIAVIYEGRIVGVVARERSRRRRARPPDGRRASHWTGAARDPPRTPPRPPALADLGRAARLGRRRARRRRRAAHRSAATTRSTPTRASSTGRSLREGAFTATLIAATPLLFTGLAAAVAFRMGVFNIGGEGQFIMGAIGAIGCRPRARRRARARP